MPQPPGIGPEHDQVSASVQPAIDAEIFKADALLDFPQHPIVRGVENRGGILQKCLLFPLHPRVIGHVGAVVMPLPLVRNREVIRQNLLIHEDEAVFPEIAIGRAVVDVLDQIVVGVGRRRQKDARSSAGPSILSKSSPPWVPTGRARMVEEDGNEACNVAAARSAPAFQRRTFGRRHPAFPSSRPATLSRVVVWIARGSLIVGLSRRAVRSAASGSKASAWAASEIRLTTTCTSCFRRSTSHALEANRASVSVS